MILNNNLNTREQNSSISDAGSLTNQRKEGISSRQGAAGFESQAQSGLSVLDDESQESLAAVADNLTTQLQTGTSGNDRLNGTDGNDYIKGLAGNDTIRGKGGDDILDGGEGDDRLYANDGADRLYGGEGDDRVYGNDGDDLLKGGNGTDRLYGGNGADRIFGGEGSDYLRGQNGNDSLSGGAGDDTVYGGSGADRLFGNAGNDILKGGNGNDIFVDNQGTNTIVGGRGQDEVRFAGNFDDYTIKARGRSFVFENKQTGSINTVSSVERFAFNDQGLSLSTLKESFIGKKDTNYHSFDGSFNNLKNPDIGKVDSPYRHIAPKDESRSMGGAQEASLPNPRDISNAVFTQDAETKNDKGLSDMFWLWGQFLDHDITLTPTVETENADIPIPKGDPLFDPQGTGDKTMSFDRSVYIIDDQGVRNQTNHITAVIDGSNIYGSSKEAQEDVRSGVGGKLTVDENNRMPKDSKGHFVSGDERVNENVGLTSMHTIWVREHNQVADQIASEHPTWKDEKIFQEARKKVVGEMQAISANEFYPEVLGGEGLKSYQGYNPDVSPQISNEFASAAYRFGHTMLSPDILRLDEDGKEIPEGNLALRDAFFRPDKVEEAGIDPILRGFADHTAQAADAKLVDDVRNFLFGPPGSGGFDLATLNIQRGRDHGIAGYNDVREAAGLFRITSFDDPIFQGDSGQRLASVYSSPDQVDLWVGGLAENAKDDGLFGSTFSTILRDQFTRSRDGDRFWYENRFSGAELSELNNLKLSDVIERNSDIKNLQDDVFIASNNFVQPVADPVQVRSLGAAGSDGATGTNAITSQPAASDQVIENVAEITTNTIMVSAAEASIIQDRAFEGAAAEAALEAESVTSDAELRQAGILPKE